MPINVERLGSNYLNNTMDNSKIMNLVFEKCKEDSHVITCDDIEEELVYSYRHSLHSTRGNMIEYILNKYIQRDSRFVVLTDKDNTKVKIRLPKIIVDRIGQIITDYRCRTIDLRDDRTYQKVVREIFEMANSSPKMDMILIETQIDLLFKDKNSSKYFYYELKSHDNHDMKHDLGTLTSFFIIYAYLVMNYKITDFKDIEIGIVYILEDSTLIARSLSMGYNGALSFKEFCERFYTVNESSFILSAIQKSIHKEIENQRVFFNKVAKVYTKEFKGTDFSKRQLKSAIENYTYSE